MDKQVTILKPDALLFDMDGTLWDGVNAYAQGFNDFFKAHGIKRSVTKKDLFKYMGMEEEPFLALILPEFTAVERKTVYREIIELQYKRIETDGGVLYEGVKEGLSKLAEKYKLFIVSNCPEFTIQYFMDWAHIGAYFTDTMAHGMNYRPKHENIKYLIDKYHLQSPVYIGDTDSDRKQCELLDIPFGFVSYGFGDTMDYNLRFDSFDQLTNYFYTNTL
ncbi:HAD-IA family hydrolase [Maribacter sp. TH_r10]|uniref:HAD family hydrolase n=1 Tax=Maribacter TaxID=252356 RepID=UPI00248F5D0F|nr:MULTISPECIES: HAD-IA family hydrolase [Maribacter]MDV7139335.1 HAD-IA family hydrolase [Maribacter sp. TH_r10]